ncbi:MAG: hypothetical protein ACI9R3_005139 [Verrucomicrobiales bacterium]|jgi:hypothetical protein
MTTQHRVLIIFLVILFPLLWFGTGFLLEQYRALSPAVASGPKLVWYKGNTHTHTLWSDGNDFPEPVVRFYRENGYHFLVLSDHNILSRGDQWMPLSDIVKRRKTLGHPTLEKYRALFGDEWVQTRKGEDGSEEVRIRPLKEFRGMFEKAGEFLMIEGEEVTGGYKSSKQKHEVHINAVNLAEVIEPQGGDSVQEVIANTVSAIREQEKRLRRPILEHLNHPNFQWSIRPAEIANVIDLRFFEVYNGHTAINHLGREASDGVEAVPGDEQIWDIVNSIRIRDLKVPPLLGVATDDSHHYHGGDESPGRGWVMVHSRKLAAPDLIGAMRDGQFYASTGVTLELLHDDVESMRVDVEPQTGATYIVEFFGTREGGDPSATGELLASYEDTMVIYRFSGDELFVRARVTSSLDHPNPSFEGQKQQAWTQPVGWKRHLPVIKDDEDAQTAEALEER